jgi:hypothetical protein
VNTFDWIKRAEAAEAHVKELLEERDERDCRHFELQKRAEAAEAALAEAQRMSDHFRRASEANFANTETLGGQLREAMMSEELCAKCGHTRVEHSYNGPCYGICGDFTTLAEAERDVAAQQALKEVALAAEWQKRAEDAEARLREKEDTIWGLKQFNKAIGKHAEKASPKIMTRLRFCAAHGSCPDGAPTPEETLTLIADLERQIDEANSENDSWLTAVGALTERAEAAEAALAEAQRDAADMEEMLTYWQNKDCETQRQLHELSVKYTVALDQNREMREALKGVVHALGWHVDQGHAVAMDRKFLERGRAAIASQQPKGEPDEA